MHVYICIYTHYTFNYVISCIFIYIYIWQPQPTKQQYRVSKICHSFSETQYVKIVIFASRFQCVHKHTSSTAQGGGGSFKNRKPIGEVGCCESRNGTANPLMDWKVVGVVLFWIGYNGCSGHLIPPHLQLLDVVWCSAAVVVVVVWWSCSCGVV